MNTMQSVSRSKSSLKKNTLNAKKRHKLEWSFFI